jgi:hypothetical protein
MNQYYELDWEQSWSPLYGKAITIPKNTILWRSYDKSFPVIGERFAYYSSNTIASGYKKNSSRELGHFVSSRPLNLLDYRFMKVLLTRLLQTNQSDKTIQYFGAIMLSFGLCSFGHQLTTLKDRYRDLNLTLPEYKQIQDSIKAMEQYYIPGTLIEQIGVRVAETTNDTFTMGFLQELFKGVFDGFISPSMYSPFHTEKNKSMMSPEIIIFNPKYSGIELKTTYPTSVKQLTIDSLIRSEAGLIVIENVKKDKFDTDIKLEFFMGGGSKEKEHYLDKADELLNSKNKQLETIYMNGKKAGSKWRKKIDISRIEPPVPCYQVSPFLMGGDIGI